MLAEPATCRTSRPSMGPGRGPGTLHGRAALFLRAQASGKALLPVPVLQSAGLGSCRGLRLDNYQMRSPYVPHVCGSCRGPGFHLHASRTGAAEGTFQVLKRAPPGHFLPDAFAICVTCLRVLQRARHAAACIMHRCCRGWVSILQKCPL